MKTAAAVMIILFYLFFFIRSALLSRRTGKKVKSTGILLNLSILCAAIASLLFMLQVFYSPVQPFLFLLSDITVLASAGTLLICIGLICSSLASLNLGKSWRIGIHQNEQTGLVTSGIYGISRNPYFLSYDIVLAGIGLCSQSAVIVIFSLVTALLFHLMILREEKYLEGIHGEEYIDYKRRVHRYL